MVEFTSRLPEHLLRAASPGDTFPVLDEAGECIGEAVVTMRDEYAKLITVSIKDANDADVLKWATSPLGVSFGDKSNPG